MRSNMYEEMMKPVKDIMRLRYPWTSKLKEKKLNRMHGYSITHSRTTAVSKSGFLVHHQGNQIIV